jgi:hypothetical protein
MPDRRKSWGRRILVLLAVGLMTQPALASNCSFWKDLLCATPIASCALTAGFAGAGKLYECVHAGSPWCAECIDGFADPRDRDPNAASGGGAGVACSKDGCHFSNMTEGLSAPPPVAAAMAALDQAPPARAPVHLAAEWVQQASAACEKQNVATRVAVGTFRLEGNAPGSVQMTA